MQQQGGKSADNKRAKGLRNLLKIGLVTELTCMIGDIDHLIARSREGDLKFSKF